MNGSWRWSSRPFVAAVGRSFSDPAYLDRYGFIPDTMSPARPLPIGFAQGGPMLDPIGRALAQPANKQEMTGVGLTCAACHTGRFTYKDTAVVIDGGPALTDLLKMKQGIGVALLERAICPAASAASPTASSERIHGRRPRGAENPDRPGAQSIQAH